MLEYLLVAVSSIVFVVDPIGVVPSYLAMTATDDQVKRRRTASRAAMVATGTLLVFALAGGSIVSLFGVSLPAFRIAGGLVLLLVALDMMKARRLMQETPGEVAEGAAKEDIAITPLAIPMLAGPAALSTVTLLMNQADTWARTAVVLGVIVATGLIIAVTLRLAERLHRLLGNTGIHVLSRIMGLVLLALGVQFILDGAQDFFQAGH